MRTIYKYQIPIRGEFELELPMGYEILAFKRQNKHPMIWVLHETDNPKEVVKFNLVCTGEAIDDRFFSDVKFIGTEIFGHIVFHLFQMIEANHEE